MQFENIINTIQLGNSYDLIKQIPDNSIDLVIIDPPYEYTTGGKGKIKLENIKHYLIEKIKTGVI